jgi:hypothetical protein
MTWQRALLLAGFLLFGAGSAFGQTIGLAPAIPQPVRPSDQIFIFRQSAPVYSTTVATLLSGLTTGIFGPASSTNGYVPVWNGVAGNSLAAGLPVGLTGNSTIVETNSSGLISTSILPSSVTLLGNLSTGTGSIVLSTSPSLTTPTLTTAQLITPTIGTGGANFTGSSSGTTNVRASASALGTLTLPAITGTLITNADLGTVSNTMLASSIMTINGQTCALGQSCVVPVIAITTTNSAVKGRGLPASGVGPPVAYACVDVRGTVFAFPFLCR